MSGPKNSNILNNSFERKRLKKSEHQGMITLFEIQPLNIWPLSISLA